MIRGCEAEGKPDQEPPEDIEPNVSEAMGVDHEPGGISSGPAYTPGVASSSGGPIRMPTIPEERPEISGMPQGSQQENIT